VLFRKNLEIFNHDIQSEVNQYPGLLKQNKGKRDTRYFQFIEKVIANFALRFGDLSLRKQLLRFL